MEAKNLLAEALRIDPSRIDPGCRMGGLREWDSLAHMSLVALVEERLKCTLSMDEIVGMVTLEGLAAVVQTHSGMST